MNRVVGLAIVEETGAPVELGNPNKILWVEIVDDIAEDLNVVRNTRRVVRQKTIMLQQVNRCVFAILRSSLVLPLIERYHRCQYVFAGRL